MVKSDLKKVNKKKCRQSGGSLTPAPYPNTLYDPSGYSSNVAKVSGHGCAGTKLNAAAAKGKYVPYGLKGGGVCLNSNPNYSTVISPRAGYANVKPCGTNVAVNPASMGAGQVAQVGRGAHARAFPFKGGTRKRKSKCRHKTKHRRKSVRRSKSGHKSKQRHKRTSVRRAKKVHRGGSGEPYSNVPISFGYGLGAPFTNNLSLAENSSLANPPPHHVYDHCPSK